MCVLLSHICGGVPLVGHSELSGTKKRLNSYLEIFRRGVLILFIDAIFTFLKK